MAEFKFTPSAPKPSVTVRSYRAFTNAIVGRRIRGAKEIREGDVIWIKVFLDGPNNVYVRRTELSVRALRSRGVEVQSG